MELLNEIRLCNQIRLVNLCTFEIDENVKRDKTIDFVALLNMWGCWIEIRLLNQIRLMNLLHLLNRWECKTRWDSWICYMVEYVGLLNEIWMRN